MKNNYKNREMFFGQYIGQEVFCDTKEPLEMVSYQTLLSHVGDMSDYSFVKLKSLIEISDNDAIGFYDIVFVTDKLKKESKEIKIDISKSWITSIFDDTFGFIPGRLFQGLDFLRSKSYVLPYMGLPIDKLIEYGWVILD